MIESKIALIGLGQMAKALASGWVRGDCVVEDQLFGFDPDARAVRSFRQAVPDFHLCESNAQAVASADIVILAVKPNCIVDVAREIQSRIKQRQLVISIAAGVSLEQLTTALKTHRVVRVMPNTPCLIRQGALAYAQADAVTEEDLDVVDILLCAVGVPFNVSEHLLDAVTGLSGSGPAYVYLMIEALSDGGVRAGLGRDIATQLAAQTVLGAAQMVLETGTHPAVLKERVTSPGGTTIAGLEALERCGVRAGFMAAVAAATKRSLELGAEASNERSEHDEVVD